MKHYLAILLLVLLIIGGTGETVVYAQNNSDTVNDLTQAIDGILTWKTEGYGAESLQTLIDNFLSSSAATGGTDWYLLALGRYRSTEVSMEHYLDILDSKREDSALSTTDRLRIALTYLAFSESWLVNYNESSTEDDRDSELIQVQTDRIEFLDRVREEAILDEGITSHIYGLILCSALDKENSIDNTGFNVYKSQAAQDLISSLLEAQLDDGGFALYGNSADPDITAMVIQALAPYKEEEEIHSVIEHAIQILSLLQLDSGDYSSWGTQNMETGVQVIIALCALGEDPAADERFIKNGNDLLDGILAYQQEDGSFSHTLNGSANNTSSVQALLGFIALWRQQQGLSALFDFTYSGMTVDSTDNTDSAADNSSTEVVNDENTLNEGSSSITADSENEELSGTKSPSNKDDEDKLNQELSQGSGIDSNDSTFLPAELSGEKIKLYLLIFIAAVVLFFLILWLLRRKKGGKDLLLILVLGLAATLFVWFSNIQTEDEYYQGALEEITNDSQTVTFSIRCEVLLTVDMKQSVSNSDGTSQDTVIPFDDEGYILPPIQIVLREGDTVYDLLERVVNAKHLLLETSGSAANPFDTVYVKAIESIYEKEYGDLSGWMFSVNGEFPSVSCTEYEPSDGDSILWAYTLDLGKDVSGQ